MKEITLETKVSELLEEYEGMKEILIEINPKFEKLNNPILRRTLAKIAGVKQAAIVGGMEPLVLLNRLRSAVGQTPLSQTEDEVQKSQEAPEWIAKPATEHFNANRVLEEEDNPLAKAFNLLRQLEAGEILSIASDFQPEPLIESFKEKGFDVYCEEVEEKHFITYVQKK